MTRTVPLAQARKEFSGIVDEVAETHERVVVTRHGEPAAMLISVDDFEAMEETLEILSDTQLVADIKRSLQAKKRYSTDQVKARLNRKFGR